MRELWQAQAPAPFVLRGTGRFVHAWGYTTANAADLIEHARAFGDPSLIGMIDALDAIASKPMPLFRVGQGLGFLLRACPVVRLARPASGHQVGAEVDAFLAKCFSAGPSVGVSREEVYREWLASRINRTATTGAVLREIRVAAVARERLLRRTHGRERSARQIERPDVRFEGTLEVTDSIRFHEWLARGVGRHRAFGFGALILVPPGTVHSV
jgi:CRISPR system Cascade subunit CasE